MKTKNEKLYKRKRRHYRCRKRVLGTTEKPRLAVFRSLKHIYAQLIDDAGGRTLGSASSVGLRIETKKDDKAKRMVQAREVGKRIAEVAKEKGIKKVGFDRGGHLYHGRVAALAKSARGNGLEF